MLFNSIDFLFFLPLTFLVYWIVLDRSIRLQNAFILAASYFFYGCWDYRFLALIALSTVVDFTAGLLMQNEKSVIRKLALFSSLFVNLGMLAYFKYANFFIDSMNDLLNHIGMEASIENLKIILPVGISFYTFQTLSYSIDIYRKEIEPTKNFISFAAYVSFFPQLVAGPIERAKSLLPQFENKRIFSYVDAKDGLRQILWGLFMKVVIADNCAILVNQVFENPSNFSGVELLLGAILFSLQIYGDFAGYSNIAIGTARLLGFNLMQNFAFPYFSRDIAEFWRRWHISLSTWFRDYLYIPLGGSRRSKSITIRNVFAIFLVSGFWHGANWTFIVWGFIHACLFLPLLILGKNRKYIGDIVLVKGFRKVIDIIKIAVTFLVVSIAWIYFRAENLASANAMILGILHFEKWITPELTLVVQLKALWFLIIFFITMEWFGRKGRHALEVLVDLRNRPLRWLYYSFILFLIGMYMQSEEVPFIYFQF